MYWGIPKFGVEMRTNRLPREPGHGLDQRMDGAPVLQVAAQPDAQAGQRPLLVAEGHQIGQGLGRMEMPAVPGVDHRHTGIEGSRQRGPGRRVPHGDDVGVAADHPDGVFDGLTLRHGGVPGIGQSR